MDKEKPSNFQQERENKRRENKDEQNIREKGRHMGNRIRPVPKEAEKAVKMFIRRKKIIKEKPQKKLYTERIDPERAAKDPKIQELKAKQEKEHPQPKKEQVVKQPTEQKVQTQKEVQPEKQSVFKKLGDKAKVLFQKIKGNNNEKNKPEKISLKTKAQAEIKQVKKDLPTQAQRGRGLQARAQNEVKNRPKTQESKTSPSRGKSK